MAFSISTCLSTGGYTTDREYFKTKCEGLYDAPCLQLRTGISYLRFLQLKKFFCLRRTNEEDVIRDPTNPRNNKTKSKTHMLDEFFATLTERFSTFSTAGNCFAIDESMIPWYGRYCPIRVYIKGKPYKYGMKLWQLCDWPSGYCRELKLYPGRGDKWEFETEESMQGWTYAERVVLCLTKDLPRGCFFTVDRNFMTPKLAGYMKNERGMYVTGTMKRNVKYIDKSLLFKKSVTVPRGFYTWSEDETTGVTQTCWMDREAVPMCSGGFGAWVCGADRLTSKGDPGEVLPPNGKKKVKSKQMKAPHMSLIYNSTMWTVDVDDFQSLNAGTSWERGCRSRCWWVVGFWGGADRAAVNCYIIFKNRSKVKYYRHSKFQQNLQTQLFHIARKQLPIGDLSAALFKEEYDYSFLWPAAPVSFHNPLPVEEVQKAKDDPMCFPGHKKGQLLDKRACFLCRKEGRYTLGTVRKDSPNGERRKLYPRTIYGCRTCNVPLCKVYNCWVKYHTGEFAGQHDYIEPYNWLNV